MNVAERRRDRPLHLSMASKPLVDVEVDERMNADHKIL
jgi:hypothetical protein